MKHNRKKIVGILAGMSCIMVSALPAAANEGEVEVWNGQAPEGTIVVEDTYVSRTRGQVFLQGFIQLSDLDGKAGVYGETLGRVDAEEVGLNLYLEKYNGSSFDSYRYWKTTEYNTSMNIKGYTVSVPQGYYYRLRGYHYVDANGIYENGSTVTEGLKIPQ